MIDTRYGDGNVSTSVTGLGIPGGGGSDLSSLFRRLVEARLGPKPGAAPLRVARPSAPVMHTGGDGRGGTHINSTYEPSWQAQQGSAMRPVGLGPGMIPGMGVDPRLLPPSMRPSGSSFANVPGASPAGLSPSRPEFEDDSSNSGFDYMSPVEKARWAAAAARSAPPPRR